MYGEGYTIRGVQRILREQGAKFVQVVWQEGAPQPPHGASEDEDLAEEAERRRPRRVEEERGLRGRLSSLIGRDLGDRQDDVEARREPPLKSAPVPRIEPTDRAIHGVARRSRAAGNASRSPLRRRFAPRPVRAAGWRARTCASCTPCCMSWPNAASSSKPRWRAPNKAPQVLLQHAKD